MSHTVQFSLHLIFMLPKSTNFTEGTWLVMDWSITEKKRKSKEREKDKKTFDVLISTPEKKTVGTVTVLCCMI